MSQAANIEVARRFFEEFCNERKAGIGPEIMTADTRYIDPQMPFVGPGPQAMADAVGIYQNSLDGHWGVEQVHAVGDERVVAVWTGTGVHTDELMGIPATGKPIRVSALSLFRFEDGKIAEHRCNWDTLGLLQQIGAVPTPG